MDSNLLQRFQNGSANDTERQQCEAYLSDPDVVVEWNGESERDPLLETLRLNCEDTEEVGRDGGRSAHLESLVQQVEKMAMRHAIGPEELARILDPPLEPGRARRIARFRVIEFIAGGGMGLVFRAEDPELDRPICIKVMNPLLASRGDANNGLNAKPKPRRGWQHETNCHGLRSRRVSRLTLPGDGVAGR